MQRVTNPRSTHDSQARKIAVKSLEIMKRSGLLNRRSDLISDIALADPAPLAVTICKVKIQDRSVPVLLVVDRDDSLDWIHVAGRYRPKGRYKHQKEMIIVDIYRPWKLTSRANASHVHKDIVGVARHEMQHALQKPEEPWLPSHMDRNLGYGSLARFKRGYLNEEEVDAYAAGIYGEAKKSRSSFYRELGNVRSTLIRNWPDIDKKLIDRFIVMVHNRAIVLYPELLKQKAIPKKRIKRERKERAKAAMAGHDFVKAMLSRQSSPRSNPTKKKAASKKTPPYQLLINRCQKLWDHYCERPSKSRLKPVLEHLEKMKASTSKRVADERKSCLRIANKEARSLKMK